MAGTLPDASLAVNPRRRLDRSAGPGDDCAVSHGIRTLAAGCLATALSWTGTAVAGEQDFRLNGTKGGAGILFDCDDGSPGRDCQRYVPDQEAFRDFTTQLGLVLAPRMAAPARTLGYAGFHLSAMWSGTMVSEDADYWLLTERGQRSQTAAPLLSTLQLDARKGLPFSFEVGANFMWLVGSQVFAPGLEVRWALQEGARYIPDLSLRGAVSHMVGNRDLLLSTVGLDAMLSKSFGVAGMVNVTPYAGWGLLMVAATSRVIDPTPTDDGDAQNDFVFASIRPASSVQHKLTLGLRTVYHVLNVTVQGDFQMLDRYTQGSAVTTVSVKLGLDF
jgi:hypothetical protein